MNFDELKKIIPNSSQELSELKKYGKDWTTYFDIQAAAVCFPTTTEQVRDLIQWARKNSIALIPSGGRTGLSGGACATHGEVVVSMEKMNRILNYNPIEQILTAEAGAITQDIQKYASDRGLLYPVDFAAKGSSHIGGNVATNAGGIKVLRYGLTRQWVTGLKVVTGKGEILELNHSLVKNATGYDLRHLFIGSEGTLGFITEVSLQLCRPPQKLVTLLMACESLDHVMQLFALFRSHIELQAFEMFSRDALVEVMSSTGLSNPFSNEYPFYVVCEIEPRPDQDENALLEQAMERNLILDGLMSQSETQAKTFWRYREDISESLAKHSPYKNDISVPISRVPEFVKSLDLEIKKHYSAWKVICFGHIGDGNLHINILRPKDLNKEDFVRECQKVDAILFALVQKFKGSISAEHGVGLTKKSFLHFTRSTEEIQLMRQIKNIFDPDGIINPGKMF